MSPFAFLIIHNFDMRRLAGKVAHIPTGWLQPLIILAGRGAIHPVTDNEENLGIRGMSATDEKPDETALDNKRSAREFARRVVSIDEGVDQAFAKKTGDRLLIGQR